MMLFFIIWMWFVIKKCSPILQWHTFASHPRLSSSHSHLLHNLVRQPFNSRLFNGRRWDGTEGPQRDALQNNEHKKVWQIRNAKFSPAAAGKRPLSCADKWPTVVCCCPTDFVHPVYFYIKLCLIGSGIFNVSTGTDLSSIENTSIRVVSISRKTTVYVCSGPLSTMVSCTSCSS